MEENLSAINSFKVEIYDFLIKRAKLEQEIAQIDQVIAAKNREIEKIEKTEKGK